MNKEIAQQVLDALMAGANAVSTEIPLVATQLIHWMIAQNAITVILCLVVFFAAIKYLRWWNSQDRKPTETETCFWVASMAGIIIGTPIFLCHIFDLVKCIAAPKIVLLEYLADFVK